MGNSDNQPRGILRNAPEQPSYSSEISDIDRKKVIENTMLNAKLTSESEESKRILSEIARNKNKPKSASTEHLKWDEHNITQTEAEKNATMKIDEPKTPYQGGFDPNNDYYRTDNEDDLDDPGFSLGEPEVALSAAPQVESLNGGTIIFDENAEGKGEEDSRELTAEEKKKRFDELRKQHYHMKGSVLHQPIPDDDNDE